ncbi:MAG: hypothetical protein M3Y33_17655 [Actinomycetota bacterium]|nr:hypothetical protein [Actinomycetota bacterium]
MTRTIASAVAFGFLIASLLAPRHLEDSARLAWRVGLAGVALAISVVLMAGCASHPPSPRAAALSYMHAHPAPARPGMVAGIVMKITDLGEQPGTAYGYPILNGGNSIGPERVLHCPANAMLGPVIRTTAVLTPAVGTPACHAWSVTLLTASGRTLSVACGGAGRPCLAYPEDQGDYAYLPADGQITGNGDVRTITFFAVVTP